MDEKCVLLLGPEVGQKHDIPDLALVYKEIEREYGEQAVEYLEDIGLLLFRDDTAKIDVQRDIRKLYGKREFPQELYRHILEIPFSLVLSLTPDTFLSDLGRLHGVPHQNEHFRHNGQAQNPVLAPTRETPLFYSLLGSVREEESLIVDYGDLFDFLSRVLGSPGIPEKIRTALDQARSFFFIGFDFEKWYTQLLLQLLIGKGRKGARRIAIKTDFAETKARTFLIHQFALQFLGNDQHFFEKLYDEFCRESKLRVLKQPLPKDTVNYLRELVAEDKLKIAIEDAMQYACGTKHQNTALALSGRYREWANKRLAGTVAPAEETRQRNSIREDLIALIDQLK